DRPRTVDCVLTHPRARTVRTLPSGHDLHPHGALAATLDHAVGRFHEDREVPGKPFGVVAGQPEQPVAGGVDLLVVVEDVRDVVHGPGHELAQPKLGRDTGLHVGGTAPVQEPALDPGGDVVDDGHGVDVPGDDHATFTPQVGTGHHGVAVPGDGETAQAAEPVLHHVGEYFFVTALRTHIDEGGGQVRHVRGQIQHALARFRRSE